MRCFSSCRETLITSDNYQKIIWVFRHFGEAACAGRNLLTESDIVLLKNHLYCHFIRSHVLIGISSLFSLPEGLEVEGLELQGNLLAGAIVSVLPCSCCPLCSQTSSQVHSWYRRTLRDVPCASRQVILHLSVRKFFCRNPECARKIITLRLPTFVEPWAQVTRRLFEAVQAVGFATSGELETRLADRIGIHSSPTTMLRRMMALSSPSSCQVSWLGRDAREWIARGSKFGTILVDLATHAVLDLLASPQRRVGCDLDEKASRNQGGE